MQLVLNGKGTQTKWQYRTKLPKVGFVYNNKGKSHAKISKFGNYICV